MGLGLIILFAGFTLEYAAISALDPRCLIMRAFNRSLVCNRIDAGSPNPASAAFAAVGTSTFPGNAPIPGPQPGGTFNDNSSTKNFAKAMKVAAAVQVHFPSAREAGICNCRHQRGTGSDPNRWSVHSVCGAVDFFTTDPNGMIAYAKTLPDVWDAWLDASPGDVHIQVIPNPPSNWVPPCAGGQPGKPLP